MLLSALNSIRHDSVEPVPQSSIHPVGSYFGMRTAGDETLNFSWSAERVFNFVRAISNPGPGARFFVGNKEYAVENASLIQGAVDYIATEGEVVGKTECGIVVKVGDSTICFRRLEELNPLRISPRFRIGTRLRGQPLLPLDGFREISRTVCYVCPSRI